MRHLLIICLGVLSIALALLDVAGRSGQIGLHIFGIIFCSGGLAFLVVRAIRNKFAVITLFESLLFVTGAVLNVIILLELTK